MERRTHVAFQRSSRAGRAPLVISDERLDGATQPPKRVRDPIRRRTTTHVDSRSTPAMACPDSATDHSPRLTNATPGVTELLADIRGGRREAFDEILPLVYHELRRVARRELASRPSDTLSTTALVHELYLKLSRAQHADWRDRAHFLSVAAVAMRHILVDRARRRTAEKRGGPQRHVTLDDQLARIDSQAESLLELHDALDQLAQLDERLTRVVECRFFGGMTEKETAEALGITERTVRRDWIKARGLLYQTLGADASRGAAPAEGTSGA
jgi:RNA polymerase sigma factor (TIGR02999 family)